jgi:hypothetical protein
MKKYYFFNSVYQYHGHGDWKPMSGVADKHPIEYVKYLNDTVENSETKLLGWQEITEEEYNMYNKSQHGTEG